MVERQRALDARCVGGGVARPIVDGGEAQKICVLKGEQKRLADEKTEKPQQLGPFALLEGLEHLLYSGIADLQVVEPHDLSHAHAGRAQGSTFVERAGKGEHLPFGWLAAVKRLPAAVGRGAPAVAGCRLLRVEAKVAVKQGWVRGLPFATKEMDFKAEGEPAVRAKGGAVGFGQQHSQRYAGVDPQGGGQTQQQRTVLIPGDNQGLFGSAALDGERLCQRKGAVVVEPAAGRC